NLNANITPGVRHNFVFTADMVANTCTVSIDGVEVINLALAGASDWFVNTDQLNVFPGLAADVEFESARIWVNDLAGAGPAHKVLLASDGIAALTADPWWTGAGQISAL
ncbi:MAG: hypothetical protein AAGF71_10350, partial [Pseudomonadota bacterium]